MSTVLTAYSHDAFKRFLLPAINNADYTVFISENLFNIRTSIELLMEVTDGYWSFTPVDEYEVISFRDGSSCFGRPFFTDGEHDDTLLALKINDEHILTLIISNSDTLFSFYQHYRLGGARVTIGRDHQTITYDYLANGKSSLSSEHASILPTGDGYLLQDTSTNGTYLNSHRVTTAQLKFGDCIDIFGLRIVFLGDSIAVNAAASGAVVSSVLQPCPSEAAVPAAKHARYISTQIFHRSPRRAAGVEEGEVKIDDAPQPKDEVRQSSVFAVMGSVLSMSLPMLLGCAFMIYASRSSGMNNGLFMYVGLVTAVTSAIFGTIRSVRAMRDSRTQFEEFESRRNQKYGEYLNQKEQLISQMYTKNQTTMIQSFPAAIDCTDYDADHPELWSRNSVQKDFLTVRLGLGTLPFQVAITIPDEKFTMIDNTLADKPAEIRDKYRLLHDVPVCVDLMEHRLIGVVGGRRMSGALQVVRDLVAQITANNVYTEVKLAFIYDDQKNGLSKDWNYTKWLPHVWNETESFRYIASDKEEAREVFYELSNRLRERLETADSDKSGAVPKPYYILFIANPELLDGELIRRYIFDPEDACGLTTVILTEHYEDLPNECEFVIENDEEFQGYYSTSQDRNRWTPVVFDDVTTQDLEHLASNIVNLRVKELEGSGDIPDTITFLDMYGVHRIADLNVLDRWKKSRSYETMRALIGEKNGGAPCYLDIHEKYHGPHGLVAGTTGSGKSETLETYILSLSIEFSPDDVGFFIIDYKGGGMASLFTHLPHMIGQISNLSGNQINRALVSIQSEKDRREALFKDANVKDIRDYTKLYQKGMATVPLPHLIIVIDEFAELKHDQPEFIQEIVSVSRVGRSLGIHLIMSTQKPAGSVSEDIWANSKFKLCLRVQSRQDSMDMLHKPDAAYLTQTGRAYLQVGNDELYEQFQSGYSGAPYSEDEEDDSAVAAILDVNGKPVIEGNRSKMDKLHVRKVKWIARLLQVIQKVYTGDLEEITKLSYEEKTQAVMPVFDALANQNVNYPITPSNIRSMVELLDSIGKYGYDAEKITAMEGTETQNKVKLPLQPETTQLTAVVEYLNHLARANGYTHDFSLFQPLLRQKITLAELPQIALPWNTDTTFHNGEWPAHTGGDRFLQVAMGMYDDPENQRQDTYVLNVTKSGNVAIFGAPTTGKTTVMQTIAYGLIHRYSPEEVNLYIFEYSARKFSAMEEAPQVGGIVHDGDDNDRIDKFFVMIMGILKRRKKLLRDVTFESYTEQHGMASLPGIVVMIDNYASFASRTSDKYQPFLVKLLKEGLANGIYIIITAAGTGNGELPNSMFGNFRTVITLEMNNQFDYGTYMRMSHLHLHPEVGIKGRGLAMIGDRVLEYQTALPFDADNDALVGDRIRNEAQTMSAAWHKDRAEAIPSIPEKPVWQQLADLSGSKEMFRNGNYLPVGYDARTAMPYAINLAEVYSYIISGARKKGKTNLLRVMMLSAQQLGGQVVVVDYAGELDNFCKEHQLRRIGTELEMYQYVKELIPVVKERNLAKQEIRKTCNDELQIYQEMQKFEKIFILIDNYPDFVRKAYHPSADANVPGDYVSFLQTVTDKCTLHNIFWFIAMDKESIGTASGTELYRNMVRDKKGIHLGGNVHLTAAGGMSFENQNRRTVENARPVGIGMLAQNDNTDVTEIVIPMA